MKTDSDILILFSTRIIRLFCYGFLSVVLALYLSEAGFTEGKIGLLFTFTLIGDAVITLWLTTSADRFGRKRTLILGALLMAGAGLVFIVTRNFVLLIISAIIGVISPADKDIGPFLAVEQASLTHLVPGEKRTQMFAWYNLAGSFAAAVGALSGGWLAQVLQNHEWTALESYRVVLIGYALGGFLLLLLFFNLTKSIEVEATQDETQRVLGLHRSRAVVFKLSSLFAMDAFAGALLVQSLIRTACDSTGKQIRPDQHHGVHSYPIEYLVDLGTIDANPANGDWSFASAIQHFSNGRAYASIVYHGCCCTRRALGGLGRDRDRAVCRRVCFTRADRTAFQHSPPV
jgi:MFS family permease